jgi:hypothetical protein
MLVSIVAPVYNFYPIIAESLILQTYPAWELLLVHDGEPDIKTSLELDNLWCKDDRIQYLKTDKRYNDWGHTPRERGLKQISKESSYVVISGGDNYYVPTFLELMVKACKENTIAVYCDLIHNHERAGVSYRKMDSSLSFGNIDCGNIMVRSDVAKEVGFTTKGFAADWDYINAVILKYGTGNIVHIPNVLFIHN